MSLFSRSCFLAAAVVPAVAIAQPAPTAPLPAPPPVEQPKRDDPKQDEPKKEAPWYEKFTIRGYMQARFNRIYATKDDFKNDLGDKSLAENNSFSLRRARLVVSGDVAPFLAMYLQLEVSGADAKMRDWYGDIFMDDDKEVRIRVGQSKVPYGFENPQSSQQRGPLDRTDPINSAVPGERDVGLFGYWAPASVRKRFKHLVDSGLKGSGDYGVLALGVYNGQTLNVDDKNENRHVVARVTYPIEIGEQILEVGASGYLGKFTVERDMAIIGGDSVTDMRGGAHVVLYPQPFGFQAEYNIGKGPELTVDTIDDEKLHGGYAMVNARAGDFFPFVRGAHYDGGIKTIKNAPHHESYELAVGSEWHYKKRIELTLEMDHAKRTVGDTTVRGTIFRGQLQLNY